MNSCEEGLLLMTGALVLMDYATRIQKKKKRRRRIWEKDLFKNRTSGKLVRDMKTEELSGQYKIFSRMTSSDFETLLQKIGPKILKQTTHCRVPISVQDRLAVTLRFLATGDSYSSLQHMAKISKSSLTNIIPEVCEALREELQGYMKLPETPEDWKNVSQTFHDTWKLPHCVGSLEGKHIVVQSPKNVGGEYLSYSVALFALVDGDCNFMHVDLESQGRISDTRIFQESQLHSKITNKKLALPSVENLPGRSMPIPYYFAASRGFVLSENIMKPYFYEVATRGSPKRVFNYRLGRGQRPGENAIGLCSSVFRVLRKPLLLDPEKAKSIAMAVMLLHNYLRTHSRDVYSPPGTCDYEEDGRIIEGSWRKDEALKSLLPLRNIARKPSNLSQSVRDELAAYFMKEGFLEGQMQYA